MEEISCRIIQIYFHKRKLLSYLLNACMSYIKVQTAAGLTFIMIPFNIKKYCALNMVVMERKQAAKMHKIRCMHFLRTWRQMVYCFIPATCFPKNIKMVPSLHFMVHGTVHLSRKKDISLRSFLLKMESQAANGKYSQIILREKKMCNRVQLNIVRAV